MVGRTVPQVRTTVVTLPALWSESVNPGSCARDIATVRAAPALAHMAASCRTPARRSHTLLRCKNVQNIETQLAACKYTKGPPADAEEAAATRAHDQPCIQERSMLHADGTFWNRRTSNIMPLSVVLHGGISWLNCPNRRA